jgi:hypothetical protein
MVRGGISEDRYSTPATLRGRLPQQLFRLFSGTFKILRHAPTQNLLGAAILHHIIIAGIFRQLLSDSIKASSVR